MEAMGSDLAPLAKDFMSFASSAVSGLEAVADEFKALPGPIQDLIEVIAVGLGASGPILTGLAALGLAVIGIQSIPEVFGKIATSIGLAGTASTGATAPTVAFAGA